MSVAPSGAAADDLPGGAVEVEIRPLRTEEELRACVELQKVTWGADFSETVPPSILKVSQRIGGVAAGAFDSAGRMLGFVFGLTGVERGRLVHWSDLLAVRPEARSLGIGRRLKEFQRDTLLALGVEMVYWSYDPLVARNAHLNLVRLGAEVVEYVQNMYGDSDSVLHRGLGTDRFVVAWHIQGSPEPPVQSGAPERSQLADAPVVNSLEALSGAEVVRVEVPADIHEVKRTSPTEAVKWRETTRQAFLTYLERGYRVMTFYRDAATGRCFYVLSKAPSSYRSTHAAC